MGHNAVMDRKRMFWDAILPDECLLWPGTVDEWGYGSVGWKGRVWRAHRLAWVIQIGDIPDDLIVLHSCDTPRCCNVRHLRLGTHKDNALDRTARRHGVDIDTVVRIRGLAEEGIPGASIARDLGISSSAVYRIINRKTWTHIT